jgi:hypothetical protein
MRDDLHKLTAELEQDEAARLGAQQAAGRILEEDTVGARKRRAAHPTPRPNPG